MAEPKIQGRFFYTDDLLGLNFSQQRVPLRKILAFLLHEFGNAQAPALYAGAVPVGEYLPGLLAEHRLDLLSPDTPRQMSIWIGNRTRVAAHCDQPHNVACVISGRRRYTLFSTEQIKDLYIGPLYLTMLHALLTIRDLPPAVREGWRSLFDLYVFQSQGDPMAHVPEAARGAYSGLTPERARALIAQLQQTLEQAKGAVAAAVHKPTRP